MAGEPDPVDEAVTVETVVSDPLLTPTCLALAEAVAVRYRAPIGLTLAAMLPPGLESRLQRRWEVLDGEAVGAPTLTGETLTEGQLRRLGLPMTSRWIEARRRAGAIRAAWRLRPPTSGPRSMIVVRRRAEAGRAVRGSVQRAVLDALTDGEATLPELAERLGRQPGSLLTAAQRLEAAGWVDLERVADRRDPLEHRQPGAAPAEHLVGEQVAALEAIQGAGARGGAAARGRGGVWKDRCHPRRGRGDGGCRTGSDRARPGAGPDPPDRRPPPGNGGRRAVSPPFGPLRRGAPRRMATDPGRVGPGGGRHPLGGVRPGPGPGPDRRSTRHTTRATSPIARRATTRAGSPASAPR